MIWLTWRQHRREALIFGIVVAAIAIYLIVTGRAMYADYYRVTNGVSVATCQQRHLESDLCNTLIGQFDSTYLGNTIGLVGLLLLPPLVGMFLGAPLVAREMERGTFRLIWMQSVTRLRWLLAKIGVIAGATLLVAAAFIPLFHWWNWPTNASDNVLGTPLLQLGGLLPLAYMLFALALGIAAGTLLRRTVPAIFVTLVGYVTVALMIYNWGRPNWLPPVTSTWDPYLTNSFTGMTNRDWILYSGYIDRSGQRLEMNTVFQICAPSGNVDMRPGSDFTGCVHSHDWLSAIIWQPADRYWAFQGIEGGILIALAVALLALTIWLVRRRIA